MTPEPLAHSDREGVIDTRDPTLPVIEIRKPFLRPQIVTVLRPRRTAANFRLVIDRFAVRKGIQKIETMAGSLLGFQLERVIG